MRFEDGTVMRLYRQTVQDFGLYAGLELSDGEMEKLHAAAGAMSAKMRAVRIVAASAVSKGDLEHRLIQKGEAIEDARQAVKWMSDMDLVDDRKTAEQIVQRCIHKGYGISRAKQALFEKRIPKEFWNSVLENYPSQIDAIVSFLRTKLKNSQDTKEVRKAVDALVRRGHSYGEIRKGLEQLSLDEDDFPEEF